MIAIPILRTERESGQALVEFTFGSLLAALTMFGAGLILRSEFHRTQCAYGVFEKTHAALVGLRDPLPEFNATVATDTAQAQGEAECGKAHEKVVLPALESRSW